MNRNERRGRGTKSSARMANFRVGFESMPAALTGGCVGLKNGLTPARVAGQ
jgi:hypothetical protein